MIRVNLLGVPKARRRARAPLVTLGGSLALGLMAAVIVVVAAVQFFRYQGLQGQIVELDQQIQNLTREKADLARVQTEYETNLKRKELLTARINIIEGLRAKQTGPARMLNVLASAVTGGDGVWLVGFEQAGERVTIEGVAVSMKAVADLMTRLLATQNFAEMDLKEAFQDTTEKSFERFNFTLTGQVAPLAPAT